MGYVYIVTNLKDNKQYIGKTIKKLNNRISAHFWDVKNNSKYFFHRALKKYKKENFKWIPIYYSNEELNEMEKFWIKKLNTKCPNGYNLTDGGDGIYGFKHKKKSIEKMKGVRPSIQGKNNPMHLYNIDFSGSKNPMYGKSSPMKGKNHSEKTIKSMKKSWENRTGHSQTQQTKDKISNKMKDLMTLDKRESISKKLKISWINRKLQCQ